MKRARKDPIARLLAAATAAGVRFRLSGATLQVAGADALHPDDRSCLRRYLPDIRRRLEPPAPEVDLLDLLDVDVEVITDAGRAGEVLASLRGRGALGFDIETAPRERNGGPPWAQITKAGRLAVHQPKQQGDAGLDPIRAAPRLAQIYDPNAATVYVFDLKHVPVALLGALEDVPLLAHNAAFEHMFLQAQGVRLRKAWCTLLMARLVYGAERGGTRLAEIAADLLDIDLPKAEQVSDWGADHLSEGQIDIRRRRRRDRPSHRREAVGRARFGRAPGVRARQRHGARRRGHARRRHSVRPRRAPADDSQVGVGVLAGARRVRGAHGGRASAARGAAPRVARGAHAGGHAELVAAHRDRPVAHAQRRPRAAGRRAGDPAAARGDPLGQAAVGLRPRPAREGGCRTAGCAWT